MVSARANATGVSAPATITILSNDVASVTSIADATVTEGASGTTTISMTNPAGRTCQVAVTSTNGTAVAPGDYSAFQGGLFNLAGVASDVLGLSVADDLLIEGPETFTITLALTAGADPRCQLGDNVATITILSNEWRRSMRAGAANRHRVRRW